MWCWCVIEANDFFGGELLSHSIHCVKDASIDCPRCTLQRVDCVVHNGHVCVFGQGTASPVGMDDAAVSVLHMPGVVPANLALAPVKRWLDARTIHGHGHSNVCLDLVDALDDVGVQDNITGLSLVAFANLCAEHDQPADLKQAHDVEAHLLTATNVPLGNGNVVLLCLLHKDRQAMALVLRHPPCKVLAQRMVEVWVGLCDLGKG